MRSRNQPSAYCGLSRVSRWTGRCYIFSPMLLKEAMETFRPVSIQISCHFSSLAYQKNSFRISCSFCLLSNFVRMAVCVGGGFEVSNSITNLPRGFVHRITNLGKMYVTKWKIGDTNLNKNLNLFIAEKYLLCRMFDNTKDIKS